jgi:mono/diheme cytochrome c family protein
LTPFGGSPAESDAAGAGSFEPGWVTAFNRPLVGCAVCHGDVGQGVPGSGPEIQHPVRELFVYLVRQGETKPLSLYRAPMPPLVPDSLSDADLDALYAWLGAMPKPTTGAALFADHCSYCHGADGRGGKVTEAYASAYHSAPFRRKGAELRDYVRAGHVVDDKGADVPVSDRHGYMPPFPPELLSDAELRLIEGWLPQ